MKQLSLALILTLASQPLLAHDRFSHGHYYGRPYYRSYSHHHFDTVLPALAIGGIMGYALAQPRTISPPVAYAAPPVVYGAPSVIYATPPVSYQSVSPMIYSAPAGYRYESIYDANCNCFTTALIPN